MTMTNDQNRLRQPLAASLLGLLAAASPLAAAAELGVVAGNLDGHDSLAVQYHSAPLWRSTLAARPLDVGLEYALGVVRADSGHGHRELAHVGVTPFARWWFAANTGLELVIGANVFSGTRLGDKQISTAFQFGSALGVVHRLADTPWLLGLRLTHYSPAGIKRPNDGQTYWQLRVAYQFR
jgi:lipid A 3-O-deacylase